MAEKHTILDCKVLVYKREESPIWQCSTYLKGKNRRVSTKEASLAKAKDFAEDWFLEMRGKSSRGEICGENYKSPSRSTMHHEIVTLRQVLKTSLRHG